MILHGRNLIIKADGKAIAAAKSCDINVQCEEIETATANGGPWRTALTGRKSWSVTTNQLVTSLVRPFSIVGTTVTLSMNVEGKVGTPFGGFVNNPTFNEGTGSYAGPEDVYWDKTRKKFIYQFTNRTGITFTYEHWANESTYRIQTGGQQFCLFDEWEEENPYGQVYTYYNGDLHAEKMTGTANVVAWRPQGTVGNLAQGSFQFNGNGALSPAALP